MLSHCLCSNLGACLNSQKSLIMLVKRRLVVIPLAFLTLLLFSHFFSSPRPYSDAIIPANSTLGFGAIIAVSHSQSPRRASLLWAAYLTNIDIVIPSQPDWTERRH